MKTNESAYLEQSRIIPEWITKRVVQIANQKRDIAELRVSPTYKALLKDTHKQPLKGYLREIEYLGTIMLQVELKEHPELARLVPEQFSSALLHSSDGSNLLPLEQACIIIIEEDSRYIIPQDYLDNPMPFLNLKWESLGHLLRGWL